MAVTASATFCYFKVEKGTMTANISSAVAFNGLHRQQQNHQDSIPGLDRSGGESDEAEDGERTGLAAGASIMRTDNPTAFQDRGRPRRTPLMFMRRNLQRSAAEENTEGLGAETRPVRKSKSESVLGRSRNVSDLYGLNESSETSSQPKKYAKIDILTRVLNLPNPVLIRIAKLLEERDIKALACTCKEIAGVKTQLEYDYYSRRLEAGRSSVISDIIEEEEYYQRASNAASVRGELGSLVDVLQDEALDRARATSARVLANSAARNSLSTGDLKIWADIVSRKEKLPFTPSAVQSKDVTHQLAFSSKAPPLDVSALPLINFEFPYGENTRISSSALGPISDHSVGTSSETDADDELEKEDAEDDDDDDLDDEDYVMKALEEEKRRRLRSPAVLPAGTFLSSGKDIGDGAHYATSKTGGSPDYEVAESQPDFSMLMPAGAFLNQPPPHLNFNNGCGIISVSEAERLAMLEGSSVSSHGPARQKPSSSPPAIFPGDASPLTPTPGLYFPQPHYRQRERYTPAASINGHAYAHDPALEEAGQAIFPQSLESRADLQAEFLSSQRLRQERGFQYGEGKAGRSISKSGIAKAKESRSVTSPSQVVTRPSRRSSACINIPARPYWEDLPEPGAKITTASGATQTQYHRDIYATMGMDQREIDFCFNKGPPMAAQQALRGRKRDFPVATDETDDLQFQLDF